MLGIADPSDEVVVRLESSGGAVHGYGLRRHSSNASAPARSRSPYARQGGGQRWLHDGVRGQEDRCSRSPSWDRSACRARAQRASAARASRRGLENSPPAGTSARSACSGASRTRAVTSSRAAGGDPRVFKRFIGQMRPALDIEAVATGEHWYGTRAVELGLADARPRATITCREGDRARVFEVLCERPRSVRSAPRRSRTPAFHLRSMRG